MNKHLLRRTKQRAWDEEEAQLQTADTASRKYGKPINKHRFVWVLLIAGIAMAVGPLTVYALRVGVVLSLGAILVTILAGAITGGLIAVFMRESRNMLGWVFVGVLAAMSVTVVLLAVIYSQAPTAPLPPSR